MNKLIFYFLITIITINGYANNYIINNDSLKKDTTNFNLPKNSIYLELLGSGIFYSINYERVLFNKLRNSINCRIGLTFMPIYGYANGVPLLINYQISINKTISFELGIGSRYINYKIGSEHPSYGNAFDIIGNTGIRLLIKNRFLFKVDYTPQFTSTAFIIGFHGNPMIYFGVSLGYSFGK